MPLDAVHGQRIEPKLSPAMVPGPWMRRSRRSGSCSPPRSQRVPKGFESSAPLRSEADCAHHVIDLAVALPIDDSPRLTMRGTTSCAGEPTALIPMLDGFDVAEIPGEPVELRSSRAHEGTSSLVARSARMIRSTVARSSSRSSVSSISFKSS